MSFLGPKMGVWTLKLSFLPPKEVDLAPKKEGVDPKNEVLAPKLGVGTPKMRFLPQRRGVWA